jgi:Ca-activated chloride channel homolog
MRLLKLFLAVCISSSWASAQAPGQEQFVINMDARNVSVNVSVVDSAGRPVTRLTRNDFSIFEDGVLQEIQKFESVDIQYNILMIADCSGSTEANWPFMKNAVDRFAAKLRPQDKISVAQFGTRIETLMDWQAWTGSSLRVNMQPDSRTCQGTDVYSAVEDSLGRFRGINGRKGIVMLTDGMHNGFPKRDMVVQGRRIQRVDNADSDKEFQKVLKAISRSDVVFYFVAINTDLNPDEIGRLGMQSRAGTGVYNPDLIYNMQQARSRMEQIADVTGGRVSFPKKPADVVGLYEEIAREFGTNYGLWYSPSNSNDSDNARERTIEVRVKTPGLTVKQNRDRYSPLPK